MAGGRGERAIRESPLRGGLDSGSGGNDGGGGAGGLGRRGDVASSRSLLGPRDDNRQGGREWVHASAHLRPACARDDGRRGRGLGRRGDVASPRSLAGPRDDNRQSGREWVHASAHAKGALAASSTGSGGGMTEGGGVDASMDCVYWAGGCPLPLDPSTLLRVSGPSWGWIHASAHAKGALATSSTCSGGGMTEGGGLGLGHLGDAEVAGADLDAVYYPANLVIAELLEAKAV